MFKLFIIGNGFDISHGLKTKYEHFQEYLEEEYPDAQPSTVTPGYVIDGRGKEVPIKEDEVIGFIEQVLCDTDGDRWSDLETSIGCIDFENYLMDYENDEEDDDLFHERDFNEAGAMGLVQPLLAIPRYFAEWIETIDISDAQPKNDFVSIIDQENDLFLSFNYTQTLEELYGIHNVCHIHGVQGRDLLFGHGRDHDYFSDDNYGVIPGTENSFQEIHNQLLKNTKMALEENIDFFERLDSSISAIYSYGFSFSLVDEIYLTEICKRIETQTVIWYLNDFDSNEDKKRYRDIITKCGFQGAFDIYSVKR